MTEVFMLSLVDSGQLNSHGQSMITAAPEPASLAVLGMALTGLGYVRRRRRR